MIWLLLGGSLLVRSAGFAYPFMAYHVATQGHAAEAVGAVLATFGVGWFAGQLVCGWLVDRFGRRSTLVTTMLLAAVALMLMSGAHSMPSLLVGAAVVGLVFDAPRPVIGAAIGELIADPQKRAKVEGWRFGWVSNVGAAVTGGTGGVAADWFGIPALYWVNGIACAVFAVMALYCLPPDAPRSATPAKATGRPAFSDSRLLLLFGSGVAALTASMGLYAAMPMLMSTRGLSAGSYGLAQFVHAVTVIALTALIAPWLSKRVAVRPRLDILAAAAIWMTVCMGVAAFAHTTMHFTVAAAALAPAEIAWVVVAASVVHRIAPPALRGRYHGVGGMMLAAAAVVAPTVAAWSMAHGGRPLFAAATVMVGLIGAALCLPLARVLASHPIRTASAQLGS